MKFLSAATLLLSAPLLASAASIANPFDLSQTLLSGNDNNKTPVKGDNPLVYCKEPSSYSLKIDHVDLVPNPPKPYVCPLENTTNLLTQD